MSSDKVATSEVAEQDAAVNRNGDQPASETKPESPPPEETSSLDSEPQAAPVEPQSGELRAAEADGSSGAGGTA